MHRKFCFKYHVQIIKHPSDFALLVIGSSLAERETVSLVTQISKISVCKGLVELRQWKLGSFRVNGYANCEYSCLWIWDLG